MRMQCNARHFSKPEQGVGSKAKGSPTAMLFLSDAPKHLHDAMPVEHLTLPSQFHLPLRKGNSHQQVLQCLQIHLQCTLGIYRVSGCQHLSQT